jgi:twitching motility protein PilT
MGQILLESGALNPEQLAKVTEHQQRLLEKRFGARPDQGTLASETTASAERSPGRHSVPPKDRVATASEPPDAGPIRPQTAPSKAPYLNKVIEYALKQGASDLHVHSGAPLRARVHGTLRPIKEEHTISDRDAEKMIAQVMTDAQWQQLAREGQVDFAYEVAGLARCRVNAYRQHRGTDVVFRLIPLQPPSLEELGLPETLSKMTDFRTGLVLCTGPSGCGKSTTLAAILKRLIAERKEHVITVENPVEFVFESTSSWVNQRQLLDHTQSFSRALRAALREDPDVIAITELRERASIGLALSAAETGHLVLGTLHTENAGQTISRIVNAFPSEEQGHIRSMLSESLRAVISQRLVPRADGKGRVPAIEILICTTAVSNMIRENKTFQLPSVMQTGVSLGMVTLDSSLKALLDQGTITKEQARRFANAKEMFT